jgi:LysM repeat protein
MFDQLPPVPQCPGATYIVEQGDTLFMIAQCHGVSLAALLAANPQITNPDLIFPGQVICLPMVSFEPVCPTGLTYLVAPGDTLLCLARRFGVTVEEILRLNPQITDANQLQPGELICLPFPDGVVEPIEAPIIPPLPTPSPCPPWGEQPYNPSPCPPREKDRYPSMPWTPMPEPYYPGSFVYGPPRVKWEECPHRRRRPLLRRRRVL